MYSTTNMGLVSWDQSSDDFDHTQLDGNWRALDSHDHTTGRGMQIPTAGIAVNAVTSDRLADQAVTNQQLALNAVATPNIQDAAVTAAKLAAGAVTTPALADGSVTSNKLDPGVLPLGTVMLWWRPAGSGDTPGGGWEVMDGRPWGTVPNSLGLISGNIPNMQGAFARGTDLGTIGTTGGSSTANVAHSHTVQAHTHTVPPHLHGITSDGGHHHLWGGGTIHGLQIWSRMNAFDIGTVVHDFGSNQNVQNTFYTLYIKNLLSDPNWNYPEGVQDPFDGQVYMDTAGEHDHDGATQSSGALISGATLTSTNPALTTISTLPPYVGLVYIMRVR